VTVTDPNLDEFGSLPLPAVPGSTVRALVEWTENEIGALLIQLEEAEREAHEAEREADEAERVHRLPISKPVPSGRGRQPAEQRTMNTVVPEQELSRPTPTGTDQRIAVEPDAYHVVPRTTVVVRPSLVNGQTIAIQATGGPEHRSGPPSHRRQRSMHVEANWRMKAGVALVLVGILLLKFG